MPDMMSVVQRDVPSKPLAVISPTDHGGVIVVITAVTLTLVLVSLLIRFYVRFKSGPWYRDDDAFVIASVFAVAQAIPVFSAVHHGWGKTEDLLTTSEIGHIQKLTYTSDLLYIFCVFFSKASSGCLYLRITPNRSHNITVWAILVACVVWLVISVFLVAVRCHASDPWKDWTTSQCKDLMIRWDVIGVFNVITEVALFGMSIYLIYSLQMARKFKAYVIAAFGCRLLVIAAIIGRLVFLRRALNPTDSSTHSITFLIVSAVICAQLEIGYGVFASAIPTLKPFIAAYEGPRDAVIANDYNMSKLSDTGRRTMNNTSATSTGEFDSVVPKARSGIAVRDLGSRFRADGAKYSADVSNAPASGGGNPSQSSSWGAHRLSCTAGSNPNPKKNHRLHNRRRQSRKRGSRDIENGPVHSSDSSGDESSRRIIIQKRVDWSVTEQDRLPSGSENDGMTRSTSRAMGRQPGEAEHTSNSDEDVIQPVDQEKP